MWWLRCNVNKQGILTCLSNGMNSCRAYDNRCGFKLILVISSTETFLCCFGLHNKTYALFFSVKPFDILYYKARRIVHFFKTLGYFRCCNNYPGDIPQINVEIKKGHFQEKTILCRWDNFHTTGAWNEMLVRPNIVPVVYRVPVKDHKLQPWQNYLYVTLDFLLTKKITLPHACSSSVEAECKLNNKRSWTIKA